MRGASLPMQRLNVADLQRRAGYVALLGRPNVGKSTLLNRLLDQKISITSPKAQTTRRRLAGILTTDEAQIVLVDTPGILDPAYPLQHALAEEVRKSLEGVDLVLLVREAATAEESLSTDERAVLRVARGTPAFLVLNKSDLAPRGDLQAARERARDPAFVEVHAVSARTGEGLPELVAATVARLPLGDFFFDPEQVTDRSLRFLTAELVRETLYEELEEELPYASHVEVTSYDESPSIPRIEATIYVERESQKGIVIGKGGELIKRIGTAARAKIEGLAGGQVFLQLRVKVRPNWRRREGDLRRFGYRS